MVIWFVTSISGKLRRASVPEQPQQVAARSPFATRHPAASGFGRRAPGQRFTRAARSHFIGSLAARAAAGRCPNRDWHQILRPASHKTERQHAQSPYFYPAASAAAKTMRLAARNLLILPAGLSAQIPAAAGAQGASRRRESTTAPHPAGRRVGATAIGARRRGPGLGGPALGGSRHQAADQRSGKSF